MQVEIASKTSENHIYTVSKTPDANVGKSVTHPLVQWAEAVVGNSDPNNIGELRHSLVEMYHDLSHATDKRGDWNVTNYAQSRNWKTIAPELKSIVSSIRRGDPSEAVLELLGFTKVLCRTTVSQDSYLENISFDPEEYSARRDYVDFFQGSEDWLSTMGKIIWINRKQWEAQVKEQAKVENLDYLLTRSTGEVNIDDIERTYRNQIRIIYPNAKNIPIFRDGKIDLDYHLYEYSKNKNLAPFLHKSDPYQREQAVQTYLERYNNLAGEKRNASSDLAWMYATYISIHPHWDGNGTMTRTLVDHYLHRNGLPDINWYAIKADGRELTGLNEAEEKYAFEGDESPLQRWFQIRIGSKEKIL